MTRITSQCSSNAQHEIAPGKKYLIRKPLTKDKRFFIQTYLRLLVSAECGITYNQPGTHECYVLYIIMRLVKNKPTRIENGTCGRSSKRGVRIIRGEVLIDGWLEEDNIL